MSYRKVKLTMSPSAYRQLVNLLAQLREGYITEQAFEEACEEKFGLELYREYVVEIDRSRT